jgi:hypothetical protein
VLLREKRGKRKRKNKTIRFCKNFTLIGKNRLAKRYFAGYIKSQEGTFLAFLNLYE